MSQTLQLKTSLWLPGCLAICLLAGCNRSSPNGGAGGGPPGMGMRSGPPPEVGVMEVVSAPLPIINELPGRIDAVRIAEVRARVPGILLKQLFKEGADVKAGEVLFQIDPAPLQATLNSVKASLARADAGLKQAEAKANRYKSLVEFNAVSKQSYDDATAAVLQGQAEVQAAQAAVETADLNLGYATVTAPIAGRIGKAMMTEGALVGQGATTLLAVIQQLDPIYFDFTQSSTELLRLRRALESGILKSAAAGEARVTLLLEDGSVYPQAGRLMFSDISVDPTTGMVTLRAEFPNPGRWLLPGMFGRARLEQAVNQEAITVPQRAVARGAAGSASVLLVKGDNTVELRPIQIGSAAGNQWVVNSGLKAGERLIMEGLQKVGPGMAVKPVPFGPAPTAPAGGNPKN